MTATPSRTSQRGDDANAPTQQIDEAHVPSALEALLFLYGEPLQPKELARALNLPMEEVIRGLRLLEDHLASSDRGLRLLRAADGVQLVTAPQYMGVVEQFLKAGMRAQLTPAAAETLAIIAYRGPIHRAGIEAIRGVNSSFTLRQLAIRGLVERTVSEKDSRVFLYQASAAFLRHVGLTSVGQLPDYVVLHDHAGMSALEATTETSSERLS